MRIALITDSHLSEDEPGNTHNWDAAARAVRAHSPDLTVHLGDISLDGQTRAAELEFAADRVRQWPTRMLCLPGNHDVGDGSGEAPVREDLLASYLRLFGPDRWLVRVDDWQLVGINAQLLGSDTAQERDQWDWLDALARETTARHTALFLHRPVARVRPEDPKHRGRYVGAAARARLLDAALKPTLRLVVSGHTHQYLDDVVAGVRHVWMPSSAFVLSDAIQGRIGEKIVGIGLLELHGEASRFDLWCPDGMVRRERTAQHR